jgi:hypothetical protein
MLQRAGLGFRRRERPAICPFGQDARTQSSVLQTAAALRSDPGAVRGTSVATTLGTWHSPEAKLEAMPQGTLRNTEEATRLHHTLDCGEEGGGGWSPGPAEPSQAASSSHPSGRYHAYCGTEPAWSSGSCKTRLGPPPSSGPGNPVEVLKNALPKCA